jgi:hypothetical protein
MSDDVDLGSCAFGCAIFIFALALVGVAVGSCVRAWNWALEKPPVSVRVEAQ